MALPERIPKFVPISLGIVFGLAMGGLFLVNCTNLFEREPTPQRAVTQSQPVKAPVTEPPVETAAPEEVPLVIEKSAILSIGIPAIALDVGVSGATEPRATKNCHASTVCIDPPVPNQAAWYGEVPSTPSVNPVLLFAHTSWSTPEYATFNNLPAIIAGDQIVVTTETGVFTYAAETPVLVPYAEVAQSQLIYGNETEKVVLVTCNSAANAATVVVGRLVSAALR